jgi:hypothetical protein
MGSITHAFAPYRSYSIHEIDGNHTICKITCGIRPDLLFSVASPPTHPELSLSFLHLYQSSFSFVYAGSLRTHPQSKAAARSRGPRRRSELWYSWRHQMGTSPRAATAAFRSTSGTTAAPPPRRMGRWRGHPRVADRPLVGDGFTASCCDGSRVSVRGGRTPRPCRPRGSVGEWGRACGSAAPQAGRARSLRAFEIFDFRM